MYKINILDYENVKQWHNTKYGRCITSILKYIFNSNCNNIEININTLIDIKTSKSFSKKEKLQINNPKFITVFNSLFIYCKSLLIDQPNALQKISNVINEELSDSLNEKQKKEWYSIIKKIFNYEAFRDSYFMSFDPNAHELYIEKDPINFYRIYNDLTDDNNLINWGGFEFLKHLDVTICPYCNAETIFSAIIVKGKNQVKIKSALDHYNLRSQYPYLGLSLYNLVPACTRCNTNIKGQSKDWDPNKYPHPYLENFHDGIHFTRPLFQTVSEMQFIEEKHFSIKLGKDVSALSIASGLSNRALNLASFINLELIYNQLFKNEAVIILNRIRFDIDSTRDSYRRKGIPDEYMDTFYWGVSIEPAQINRNRFAKMIIDFLVGYRLDGENAIPI